MDFLPNYGYSLMSAADSQEMQNRLQADHESFISGEFAGFKSYVLNGGGHLTYLFGDGAWYAAPTNEEAMLVMETVANAQ